MIFGKKKKTYLSIFLTQSRVLISYLDFDRKTSVLVEKFESEVADTAEFAKFLESVLEEIKKKYSDTPKKTIFFLSSFYIDPVGRKIKRVFMQEFMEIFKSLSLEGLGYIETQEAVAAERERFKVKTASHFVFIEVESDRVVATLLQDKHVLRSAVVKIAADRLAAIKEAIADVKGNHRPTALIFTLYGENKSLQDRLEKEDWGKDLSLAKDCRVEFLDYSSLNDLLITLFESEVVKQEDSQAEESSPPQADFAKSDSVRASADLPFGFSDTEKDLVESDDFSLSGSGGKSRFSLPGFFKNINFSLTFLSFPANGKGKIFLFLAGIFLIIGLLFVHEFFIHTIRLRILPVSKEVNLEKDLQLEVLQDLSEYEDKEVEVSLASPTSGSKEVGEKARGEVSVYNFSTKEFSIDKGEKIKIKRKDFVFLSDLSLPPAEEATVGGSIVKKPAVKKVQIEAAEIGEEYNLSTSEKIKIRDLDTDLYYAKLEGSTKGGSKEELSTVAKSDLESLRDKVKRQASEDLAVAEDTQAEKEFIYIPELNEVEIADEEFDKEVGEVADQVSLKAKVRVRLARVAKERILDYFKKDLQDQIPGGFSYNSDSLEFDYQRVEDNENISFQINIRVKAFKDIDVDQLRSSLVFKPLSYLESFAQENPDIERIEVLENKTFLPFLKFTPANPANIQLVL